MKIKLKFFVVFAFLAGGVLFVSHKQTHANELSGGEMVNMQSRSLYRQHCATCHGNDGRGNTRRGRETEADDISTDEVKGDGHEKIVRIITNGKGEMPGFKRKLSAAQIASVARYIKTL